MLGEATQLMKLEREMNAKTDNKYRNEITLAIYGCSCEAIQDSETRLEYLHKIKEIKGLEEFEYKIDELILKGEEKLRCQQQIEEI